MNPSDAPPVVAKDAPRALSVGGWPVLRLGFRPFYLGAALFGMLAVPLWVASWLGAVAVPLALPTLLWHGHEMLFGFVLAVIVGFLLTAGKAWTGLATPRGALLGGLVLLWAAARLAALLAPYAVYAVLDLVFLPLVAAIFVTLLLRAGNHRNLPLALILVLLSVANLVFHLAVLGVLDVPPVHTLYAALALIVMIECVMAGRVVPAFTQSATPGLRLRKWRGLEPAVLATTALALALWVFAPRNPFTAAVFLTAAVLHGVRQWQWQPWVTRRRPVLWILHLAYAWLPVGLVLLACAQLGWVSASVGLHALAVGATGGLIIGMATRTARGHTGRSLQVSRAEVWAYGLVMAAAVLRVVLPMLAPNYLPEFLIAASVAWSVAFALYLVVFAPWLFSTRLDGKDG